MSPRTYRVRNLRHRARGWKAELMKLVGVGNLCELSITHISAAGVCTPLGIVCRRSVTNAGVAFLVDAFQNLVEIELMNFHACGTGTNAENVTDTALQTDSGVARVTGTQSEPSSPVYRTTATMAFTGTLAITEHGVFSASTSGTLWDRSVFSAVNVVNGDSIQFQYSLTITAGG